MQRPVVSYEEHATFCIHQNEENSACGSPANAKTFFFRLRESRKRPKVLFLICGNPANAKTFFFRFAGIPQTPKSAFFDLRESRKRPKVLFLICGNPASNKKFIFFHCGTPASVSKNFLSFADTVATRLVYLSSTDVSKTIHTGIFLPIVLRLKPGVTSPRAFFVHFSANNRLPGKYSNSNLAQVEIAI